MENKFLVETILNIVPISELKAIEIASHFEEALFEKNQMILEEGKVSNEYFFLIEGVVRAFTYNLNGAEITTSFFVKGNFIFEVASLFKRIPSKESIQAITDCRVCKITFDKLQFLFHSIPEFRELGRANLVNGFISFKQRTISLINESAETRYENLIQTNSDVVKYAPLKFIASYLGVTDTSLSRIRKQLSEK